MANSATNVRAGLSVTVYTAAIGTVAPTAINGSLTGWTDLGYVSEDGVSITPSQDVKDIMAHQSLTAVRSISTARNYELKFAAMESKSEVFKLAFGGGSFAVTGTGAAATSTYTPASASAIDERAFIVQMDDGTNKDLWIFPRTLVTDVGDISLKKDEAISYDLTVKVLTPSTGSVFTFLSSQTTAYA